MPSPAIKICGLTTPETLDAAIAARADHFGLMFHEPSPRFASLAVAQALGQRARGRIGTVGVYVDASDALLGETVEAAGLTALQFHGSETPERVAAARQRFGLPVWKVLSVATAADIDRALAYLGAADLILFDAKTPKGALQGGMGLKFDWTLLSAWQAPCPWGLAGGLSPDNVAEAVRLTGAPLVDTSSGVESAPGVKDAGKIAAFCAAARSS